MGSDTNTYCIRQAASKGSLLLAAGTKGKRFALPNSRIMIHQPHGGIGGTSSDIVLQAKEMDEMKKITSRILSECTGKSVEQIVIDSDRDFFLSPEQALNYGLIDKVATQPQKTAAAPTPTLAAT